MSSLLISVVMPVYNEQRYLAQALDSVLNQTYQNIELVVVDDGSVDGTKEILARYEKADQRLRVYSQINSGISNALNKGVKLARGDYIARMDADDVCRPDRLKLQIAFLLENELDIVGGGINRFNDSQNKLKYYPLDNAAVKSAILVWDEAFAHPAVLVSKKLLKKYNYISFFDGIEDMHLWMQMALDSDIKMGNVPSVVLDYRRHNEQVTKKKDKSWFEEKKIQAMCQVLDKAGVQTSTQEVGGLYQLLQKRGALTSETAKTVLEYIKSISNSNCFDLDTRRYLKKKLISRLYKKTAPSGAVALARIIFSSPA